MSEYKGIDDEFYSLSSDVYFKHFFSDSKMLALFLSTLWEKEIKPESITYDNTESNPPRNKEIIYDVVATIEDEGVKRIIRINLEMQNKDYASLASRMEFYAARKYALSIDQGDEYEKVSSESIWFIGFKDLKKYTKDPTRWSKTYKCVSLEEGDILGGNSAIRLLFLKNKENCPIMEIEEFLKMFEKLDPANLPEVKGTLAKEARRMVLEMNNDRKLKNDAFSHEMFLRDQAAMLAESESKGKAEGLAEGLAEGEARGLSKGKAEEKNEMVKRMKMMGLENEIIAQAANISLEELNKILDK